MERKVMIAILVLFFSNQAWSTIVTPTLDNPGFEYPGTETISWQDVPGWSSDIEALKSGVKLDPSATEGNYVGSLYNGDVSIYNLSEYIIQLEDDYILELDAINNSPENTPALLEINLYLDVYGDRVTIASKTVETNDSWTTFSLDYYANSFPAVYNKIGVELANVTENGDSWISIDNVRFVPEPATIAFLGLGSIVLLNNRKNSYKAKRSPGK